MVNLNGCILVSDHSNPHHPAAVQRDAKIETFVKSPTLMALGAGTPSDLYMIPEHTPISDQGVAQSCTANATAEVVNVPETSGKMP